jgi:hypothetical protein
VLAAPRADDGERTQRGAPGDTERTRDVADGRYGAKRIEVWGDPAASASRDNFGGPVALMASTLKTSTRLSKPRATMTPRWAPQRQEHAGQSECQEHCTRTRYRGVLAPGLRTHTIPMMSAAATGSASLLSCLRTARLHLVDQVGVRRAFLGDPAGRARYDSFRSRLLPIVCSTCRSRLLGCNLDRTRTRRLRRVYPGAPPRLFPRKEASRCSPRGTQFR